MHDVSYMKTSLCAKVELNWNNLRFQRQIVPYAFFFTEPFIWTLSKISFRNFLHEARFMLYEAFSIVIDINLGACIQDQIEKKNVQQHLGAEMPFRLARLEQDMHYEITILYCFKITECGLQGIVYCLR